MTGNEGYCPGCRRMTSLTPGGVTEDHTTFHTPWPDPSGVLVLCTGAGHVPVAGMTLGREDPAAAFDDPGPEPEPVDGEDDHFAEPRMWAGVYSRIIPGRTP